MGRLAAVVLVLGGCAHNVAQDAATGADGYIKGAKPITLENNEGKAAGIVTYPGGDRVDWKSIELPAGKHGTLGLKLTYQVPRPGLSVSFEVFDQWRSPLSKAAYHRTGHTRTATIEHAVGTYFVEVYAPKRGDAGKYKLVADFQEDSPLSTFDWTKVPVSEPPKLADVPPPEKDCDPFDPKVPSCAAVCPAFGAPPNWPACDHQCPVSPPDPNIAGCRAIIKVCPTPADPRIPACNVPAPPPPPPAAVVGRVLKVEVDQDGLLVTIGVGKDQNITKAWTAAVLRGDGNPLSGGGATIIRINKTTTIIRVKLTPDVMRANDNVRFSP